MKSWILFLTGSAIVFGLTFYFLQPKIEKIDPKDYKYMHCSRCGKEVMYAEDIVKNKCAKCLKSKEKEPGSMIPTVKSFDGRRVDPARALKSALLVEIVLFLFGLVRMVSKKKNAKPLEISCLMQCPGCHMKLKFRPKSVGEIGMCPRCKKKFIFPKDAPQYYEGEEVHHEFD